MKKVLRVLIALTAAGAVAFSIFWFARPADLAFDQERGAVPHAESSRFADLDGVRVHYQEKGAGPALVLVHGYASSSYSWKDVFDPLALHFRVIAVDLKGFGFSGKPDGDYSRRAQATLLIRLLDHLKIEQAVFCGNSMGGEIALNAALQYPQRISSLILVDSSGLSTGGVSAAPEFAFWPVIGPALSALALTSDSIVREGLQTSFYDQSKVTAERVAAYYRPLTTRGGQRAAYLARRQAGVMRVEKEIANIRQPALIIWGAQDVQIPVEAGRRLHAMIEGSQLIVFDQCGHLPQEEMPERFVREVITFADSLRKT